VLPLAQDVAERSPGRLPAVLAAPTWEGYTSLWCLLAGALQRSKDEIGRQKRYGMIVTAVAVIVIFTLMVLAHEVGHFIVARRAGVTVEEFGIGYPPRILTFAKRGDTEFTLNAIPVGGFVRMLGEEDPEAPGSLASKSRLARGLVLSAGSIMNLLLAIVLLTGVYMVGTLTPTEGEPGAGIYQVMGGTPAEEAGLRAGDTVVAVDGQTVEDYEALSAYTHSHLGEEISITIRRNRTLLPPVEVTPRTEWPEDEGPMGVGVGPALVVKSYPIWEAIPRGLYETFVWLFAIFQWSVAVLRGLVAPQVAGPIGIVQATSEAVSYGLTDTLRFAAFLSTQLGIVNMLPFPGLDGGRLVFVILEAIRRGKRVSPQKEGLVHIIGMVILLGFILVVSYFDVVRLASGGSVLP
jgi:regulator of sigma E protease